MAAPAIPFLALRRLSISVSDLIRNLRHNLTPQPGFNQGAIVHISDRALNTKWIQANAQRKKELQSENEQRRKEDKEEKKKGEMTRKVKMSEIQSKKLESKAKKKTKHC